MFFALFGAVALVGAVGAASMQVMRGPVRAMAEVTKRTVAENNMIASTKLTIIGSANQTNADCDADGFIEPIEPEDAGVAPKPAGGGYLPSTIGAALNDPWDTRFSLCSWDHGSAVAKCAGTKPLLQTGGPLDNQYAIAVISAGPDRQFQTICNAYVDTTPADDIPDTALITKGAGSDDIVLGYTYAEANNIGGGLWTLKDGDNSKATLSKDIEVRNAADTETIFGLDRTTGQAEFMAIKTDNIMAKSANTTIEFGDLFTAWQVEDMDAPSGGGGGGAADNLGNHIATMNLKIFGVAGGAGISGSEVDPQVNTLTNNKWCTTNGSVINCATDAPVTAEVDPKVGTLTNTKWCTTNGSTINCTSDAPGGGITPDVQTFNSSGTWTKPGTANFVYVECWGGGSGGHKDTGWGGGGGGGGGYAAMWIRGVQAGATETVTIGAGGAGRSGTTGVGGNGGNTTFGAWIQASGATYQVDGYGTPMPPWGSKGGGSTAPFNKGTATALGATGRYGNTNYSDACTGDRVPYLGAGGGGSAGPSGGQQSTACSISAGGGGIGGDGSNAGTAGNGAQPGGGGGGTKSGTGGNGAAGRCVVTTY